MPVELQSALLERAEGNPLYAEEFVRMLVDRGFLYRNGGGWQLRDGELPLPGVGTGDRRGAARRARPRREDDAARRGGDRRGFWPAAVAAVSGLDRSKVDDSLFSLERKELVRRVSVARSRRAAVLVPPCRRP